MFTSNPLEGNAHGQVPPAKPTPEWKELQTARQRIGLMLVAHAKAQPQALLPHLAALANKTQEMWSVGVIGTNEQSTLYDVILAAAAGADLALQKQVIARCHLQNCIGLLHKNLDSRSAACSVKRERATMTHLQDHHGSLCFHKQHVQSE